LACFAGFGLDSMDTTIYALVIPSLIAVGPGAHVLGTVPLALIVKRHLSPETTG
jgi:hypothetical protein